MVIHVAQVESCFPIERGNLIADQHVERLALGPDRPAEVEQIPLHRVHLRDGVALGLQQDPVFQHFQPLTVLFEHREVMVDHGVDQGVGQVAWPGVAQPGHRFANPLADRFKAVPPGPLLERDDKVGPDEQADLFHVEGVGQFGHVRHQEHMVGEGLDLGPLVEVDDILHCQGVQREDPGQFLQDRQVSQPVHVDPHHGILPDQTR